MKDGVLMYHISDDPPKYILSDILAELAAEGEDGAKIYNHISNILYTDMGIMGAELVLLFWHVLRRMEEDG